LWYKLVELKKTGKNEVYARVTTDHDSLWFSGHFPDNPILPGVAQLDMVADCIAAAKENTGPMTGLSRIKFRKIVRPGELLDIHATCDNKKDQYDFRITSRDEDVCSGIMRFAKKNNCP
jgi:3-hydroxymyristoyl/3-hydroxydecanoyl-(acyl carrier protein) dehydratase